MAETAAAMLCPVCRVPLTMSERQNIEIDFCPQCRGVWLDRGELDKIVERSSPAAGPAAPAGRSEPSYQGQAPGFGRHDSGHGQVYKKRRKSFLEELFD